MSEWISVKDRMPTPGEMLILSNGLYVEQGYLDEDNDFIDMDSYPLRDVKYWMPWPYPPEIKDEDI